MACKQIRTDQMVSWARQLFDRNFMVIANEVDFAEDARAMNEVEKCGEWGTYLAQ